MRSSSQNPTKETTADYNQGAISDHSKALAAKLSGHLGIESALQISAENQWDGVVAALMEIKQRRSKRL